MLFEPSVLRGMELPNRVLMAPMEKNLCRADGSLTQRYVDYLVARARGGVALMRIEATYVDPVGKGRPFQCGAHADHVIPAIRHMTGAVHAAGGRVSMELAHCGRQTDSSVSGFQPVAPSPVPCAASGGYLPRELTREEIGDIVERFVLAARRGVAGGLDAIEIHGASGYLLNAFLSPYTNLRTDEYGGSLENRMRFPLEVTTGIRTAIGDEVPLLYRMSGDDFVPGGLTPAESAPFAAELERAGVDLIDVSGGTYESITATQPPMEAEPGGLVDLAGEIKAAVSVPIATAGKLGRLDVAERALRDGNADFVTIGRGLHADPDLLRKTQEGRPDEVRRCIACAECVAFLGQGVPAFCAVNPATIRERELSDVEATTSPRRIVVVGAGPAGLEAARAARLRGHEVAVYERNGHIGGQVPLGGLVEGRADFGEPVRFLERELQRLDVPIVLDTQVDPGLVRELAPDAVVVATGADPLAPEVPGADLPHVVDSVAFLRASADDREVHALGPAVVVGGSWIGCHVADILLRRGHDVVVVERRELLGYDMGIQQGMVLRDRVLRHRRSRVLLSTTVEDIRPRDVGVWTADRDDRARVAADLVVLATPPEASRQLADELDGEVEVRLIGDAAGPRKLADALLEGARAGAAL